MSRHFLSIPYALAALALFLVSQGCLGDEEPEPSGPSLAEQCEQACDRLYNGCALYIRRDNGMAATERTCRTVCEREDLFRGQAGCVGVAECSESAEAMILECLPPGSQVEYCEELGLWPVAQEKIEQEVLDLVNRRRAEGADCRSQGSFDPAGALVMDPVLQCAARLHSVDMVERGFSDHVNPDGKDPFDRIAAAGYSGGFPQAENIASGYRTAEDVMNGWMSSDGHCSNIMDPEFNEIGIGVYQNHWTQKFGAR